MPLDLWSSADVIRQAFMSAVAPPPIPLLETARDRRELELTASFLSFALSFKTSDPTVLHLPVVRFVFVHFREVYLRQNDVHAVTRGMEQQPVLVRTFLAAMATLKAAGLFLAEEHQTPRSALLAAAKRHRASLVFLFGGQGNLDEYFNELAETCDTYGAVVRPFLDRMVAAIHRHVAQPEAASAGFYSKGFDVHKWLAQPESRPPVGYLVRCAEAASLY